MLFNPDPSKQAKEMYFSRKYGQILDLQLAFHKNTVQMCAVQKYLGLFLGCKRNFNCHVDNKKYKCNKIVSLSISVVSFRATWHTFQPKLKKIKKIPLLSPHPAPPSSRHPKKSNSLYFRKWNFLALILKKNQEMETPKKIPYI